MKIENCGIKYELCVVDGLNGYLVECESGRRIDVIKDGVMGSEFLDDIVWDEYLFVDIVDSITG